MIVYAVNNKKSFEKLEEYREAILNIKDSQNYPLVMIGNKCDLEAERKVSTDEGHSLAKSFGCPFFETSAKSRTNVDEAFFEVCYSKGRLCRFACLTYQPALSGSLQLVKEIRKFENQKKDGATPRGNGNGKQEASGGCCVIL
jgi:Fe2+ transport system protein B